MDLKEAITVDDRLLFCAAGNSLALRFSAAAREAVVFARWDPCKTSLGGWRWPSPRCWCTESNVSSATRSKTRRPMAMVICRRCGQLLERRHRLGFFQQYVLNLLGIYPWHCWDCQITYYRRARSTAKTALSGASSDTSFQRCCSPILPAEIAI